MKHKPCVYIISILYISPVFALQLDVPELLWTELSIQEKTSIAQSYEVNLLPPDAYGLIVDMQMMNQSIDGTNLGANLGAAYGQANYIDHAFNGNNIDYSATKQLGAGLAGAIVGSMLDTAPESKYAVRYTIKNSLNEIKFVNEVHQNPSFTQSIGLCVLINPIRPAIQDLCGMTKTQLTQKILANNSRPEANHLGLKAAAQTQASSTSVKVKCRINNNAPTLIDSKLCTQANGVALQQ